MNDFDILKCCRLAGADLVTYSTIISILLAQNLNSDDIDLLGNFISCIGQNLSAIALLKQKCELEVQNKNEVPIIEGTTK